MRPRLLVILTVLVVTPVLLLGGMGVRLVRAEGEQARERFRQMLEAQLLELDGRLIGYAREVEDRILRAAAAEDEAKRGALLGTGLVREYLHIAPAGQLLFPDASQPENAEFFRRTESLWDNPTLPFGGTESQMQVRAGAAPDSASAEGIKPLPPAASKEVSGAAPDAGWHVWYSGNGMQFLFWWRSPDGGIEAAEINRSRLIADIIALLPSSTDQTGESGRIRLVEAQGQTLYEWGQESLEAQRRPFLTHTLTFPFSAWQFHYLVQMEMMPDATAVVLGFVVVGAAISIGLMLLGIYFYRESSRELQDAAQRVSFVNHVSHELKTPLTNIRLYAELLEEELADPEKAAQHARIIAQESQRLSRLIGNLLTFARKQRKQLAVHRKPERVDALIEEAVELHRPRLLAKGLTIHVQLEGEDELAVDRDALDQILYNLLSNAEKYGAQGGRVVVRSHGEGKFYIVEVCDDGPGVPPVERERIFDPFYRIHNSLNEGVSGTGLGLSLARELARLHGGDVQCGSWEGSGACFRLTIPRAKT